MASILLSGVLKRPNGDLAVGDQIKFEHKSSTGDTVQTAECFVTIPPDGQYSVSIEYGIVNISYKAVTDEVFTNLGKVTVNQDNPATSIPELLRATVPQTNQEMLEFQTVLANCIDAQNNAEQSLQQVDALTSQQTTTELINSSVSYDLDVVLQTSGFSLAGDGGAGKWKQNGVTGQTPSQTPAQLGDGILNDDNGNQWSLVENSNFNASCLGVSSLSSGTDNVFCLRAANEFAKQRGLAVFLPGGAIELETDDAVMLDACTSFLGQGNDRTFLNIKLNNSGFPVAFNVNTFGVCFSDLTVSILEGSILPVSPILFQIGAANGFTVKNIVANMGAHTDNGVLNWGAILFSMADSCSYVTIRDSVFSQFKWGLLKTNSSLSEHYFWKIIDNVFYDFYSPVVTFNTPSGRVADITVSGNSFRDNKAHEVTSQVAFPHMGGVAGGNNSSRVVFCNNNFSGTGQGLHFEEDVKGVVIDGNTFNLGETAIQILDNNVGGEYKSPSEFIISNNIIKQEGSTFISDQTLTGIECVFNSTPLDSVKNTVISGNIIDGFDVGIKVDRGDVDYNITGNTIKFCNYGMRLASTTAGIENNIIKNCPIGIARILGNQGTSIGQNTFFDCNIPIDDESTGNTLGVLAKGLIVDKSINILSNTTSTHYIMSLGSKTNCRLSVIVTASTSDTRGGVYDLIWDGSSFSISNIYEFGGGNIFNLQIVNNSGNLIISIQSALNSDVNARVEISTGDLWEI